MSRNRRCGRNCTKTRRRKQESHQKPLCSTARHAAGGGCTQTFPERSALKQMPAEMEAGFGESAVPLPTPD